MKVETKYKLLNVEETSMQYFQDGIVMLGHWNLPPISNVSLLGLKETRTKRGEKGKPEEIGIIVHTY